MTAGTTIYFDLDGTVYDLYSLPEWLERITTREDATAYTDGAPLHNPAELASVIGELVAAGYRIGVVSWVAGGNPSPEFVKRIRAAKKAWIREHLPHVTETHIVKYGTPKHRIVRDRAGILVDDNAEIRERWTGATIAADANLLDSLRSLL